MKYIVAGAVLAGLAGCAWFGGGDEPEDRRTYEETGRAETDRVKVGHSADDVEATGWAIDPVTGERVPQDAISRTEWNGMTFYFASDENRKSFTEDPTAYVTEDGYLRKPLDEVQREAEVK